MKDQIAIIYEDKNFLALNKPAGLLIHETRSIKHVAKNDKKSASCSMLHASGTLVGWLLKHYPEIRNVGDNPLTRPGIVHRLDKDTSGVILIPRNQNYFNYLKNLFQTHQIKKTYLALVYGKLEPRSAIIKKPIRLKTGTTKRTVWRGKMEKEAITEYKVLKHFSITNPDDRQDLLYFSFLRIIPKTGRTHQIRIHLASVGHPIVGDSLYGFKTRNYADLYAELRGKGIDIKRQFLHAESLEFNTADGRRIKIEAGLPEQLKLLLKKLT